MRPPSRPRSHRPRQCRAAARSGIVSSAVVAPFDGVGHGPHTDIGALINAGQNSGAALFRMADTRKLRIYVQVPQPYAGAAVPGVGAQLKFAEHPGKAYPTQGRAHRAGRWTRPSRTLQVERQGRQLERRAVSRFVCRSPFQAGRQRRLAEAADQRPAVQVGRPAGRGSSGRTTRSTCRTSRPAATSEKSIEVLSGLEPTDQVVLNPPTRFTEGASVRIAAGPEKPGIRACAAAP